MGDNDVFKVKGRKQIINDKEETNKEKKEEEEKKEEKEKENNDKEIKNKDNKEINNKDKENNKDNKEINEENDENNIIAGNTDNILDEGIIGGTETLDFSDEECFITELLILNAIMVKFKKIFIMGKLALQFIQFLRQDYELFDNNL